jgi:endoglucanase
VSVIDLPSDLTDLLRRSGTAGREEPAADRWAELATGCARVDRDAIGNTYAALGPVQATTHIALLAHIDEISIRVSHFFEDGSMAFVKAGGHDPSIMAGQRVTVLSERGPVPGVVQRKRVSLAERQKTPILPDDLHLDVGAANATEARELVNIGDAAIVDVEPRLLNRTRIVSKALDNRLGVYVVLEALRRLAECELSVLVTGVASTQEEIGGRGALGAARRLSPDHVIVIDVTPSTDAPGGNPRLAGECRLGGGATIELGGFMTYEFGLLVAEVAEREAIAHTRIVHGEDTSTDAEVVARLGDASITVISIPVRYIHSPVEMADLRDVSAAIDLVTATVLELQRRAALSA